MGYFGCAVVGPLATVEKSRFITCKELKFRDFFCVCVCVIPLLLLVITAVTPFPSLTHLPTRQHSSGIVELCAGRFFGELQW